eukprot:CAMPEP_0114999866 /NCGR_PEP_ID=MMETSP0216-20121206/16406_1 /TAXON_ID=223996 /ORGANISM="Protocruzia adherens, Strain Boccale" /LENGTH=449 /DNA_ID=CAMNT_0002364833 /DNA_START=107 /DNA_END=1456 /DNA_ORIENTATION=-
MNDQNSNNHVDHPGTSALGGASTAADSFEGGHHDNGSSERGVLDPEGTLKLFIHDYLKKYDFTDTATLFKSESQIISDIVPVDSPQSFLNEWWQVFWDVFSSSVNGVSIQKHVKPISTHGTSTGVNMNKQKDSVITVLKQDHNKEVHKIRLHQDFKGGRPEDRIGKFSSGFERNHSRVHSKMADKKTQLLRDLSKSDTVVTTHEEMNQKLGHPSHFGQSLGQIHSGGLDNSQARNYMQMMGGDQHQSPYMMSGGMGNNGPVGNSGNDGFGQMYHPQMMFQGASGAEHHVSGDMNGMYGQGLNRSQTMPMGMQQQFSGMAMGQNVGQSSVMMNSIQRSMKESSGGAGGSGKSHNTKKPVDPTKTRASKYRGVSRNGNQWQVLIMVDKKKRYIGSYSAEIEAARSYDKAAIQNHGVRAKTNFQYGEDDLKEILTSSPILVKKNKTEKTETK